MLSESKTDTLDTRLNILAETYGNKSANLMELQTLCESIKSERIQIKIPDIFPLSDQTIQTHLDTYAKDWRKLWEDFKRFHKEQNEAAAKESLTKLRTLITDTFNKYLIDLTDMHLPPKGTFMVRSTGIEDTDKIANPGGNESIAAVKSGSSPLSSAIGKVVASYFSEKSLNQRLASGDKITKKVFMPVLIQNMVGEKMDGDDDLENIPISGVIYTHDDLIRIQAAPGHGELIVNSKGHFDTYDVSRYNIVHPSIYQKTARLVPTNDKNGRKLTFMDNPKALQTASSLRIAIAREIAIVARNIKKHYKKPMDIEFVYHPKHKTLYIVQARPIPAPLNQITPSAIAPELWNQIQKIDSIPKFPVEIITSAGNAAKIIENQNEVISETNIENALERFLQMSQDEQKAIQSVLVEQPSPSTSHEAAQFNALSIPVVQAKARDTLHTWFQDGKPIIILDVQRQQFICWTKVRFTDDDDKPLAPINAIKNGLFTSSLSLNESLHTIDYQPLPKNIKKYFSEESLKSKIITFSDLKNAIKDIESASNLRKYYPKKGLESIANFFLKLITSAPISKRILHMSIAVMRSISEIDKRLNRFYKKLSKEEEEKNRQEILNLTSKLKSIIINPGRENLFSDSVLQIASEYKLLHETDHQKLTDTKRAYAVQFLKLNQFAMCDETKKQWNTFVMNAVLETKHIPYLTQLMLICSKYHLKSECINIVFMKYQKESEKSENPTEYMVKKLFEEFTQLDQLLKNELSPLHQTIQSFESRIVEWSEPNKFDRLFKEFSENINPLIEKLDISDKTPPLVKKSILNEVKYLTDVIDRSIKSLKGSPEYKEDMIEALLLPRFIKMLETYQALMKKWMSKIPDESFKRWSKLNYDKSSQKDMMIKSIEHVFKKKSKNHKVSELKPNYNFSVGSARIGSTASFERQFLEKRQYITLEGLFSLMHQNTITSLNILGEDTRVDITLLPNALQRLIKEILPEPEDAVNLSNIEHTHPIITVEMNIPLENHGGRIILEYETTKQSCVIKTHFFAPNWGNRINVLENVANLESHFNGEYTFKYPQYNDKSFLFEHERQYGKTEIEKLPLKSLFDEYKNILNHDNPDEYQSYRTILARHYSNESPRTISFTSTASLKKFLLGFTKDDFLRLLIEVEKISGIFTTEEIREHIDKETLIKIAKSTSSEQLKSAFALFKKFNIDIDEETRLKLFESHIDSHLLNIKAFLACLHEFEESPNRTILIQKTFEKCYKTRLSEYLQSKETMSAIKTLSPETLSIIKKRLLQMANYDKLIILSSNPPILKPILGDIVKTEILAPDELADSFYLFPKIDKFIALVSEYQLDIYETHKDDCIIDIVLKNFDSVEAELFLINHVPQLETQIAHLCHIVETMRANVYLENYLKKIQNNMDLVLSNPTNLEKLKMGLIEKSKKNGKWFAKYALENQKFLEKILTKDQLRNILSYDTLCEAISDGLTYEEFNQLISLYDLSIHHSNEHHETLVNQLMRSFNYEIAISFIKKHTPDLESEVKMLSSGFKIFCKNHIKYFKELISDKKVELLSPATIQFIKNEIKQKYNKLEIFQACPDVIQYFYKNTINEFFSDENIYTDIAGNKCDFSTLANLIENYGLRLNLNSKYGFDTMLENLIKHFHIEDTIALIDKYFPDLSSVSPLTRTNYNKLELYPFLHAHGLKIHHGCIRDLLDIANQYPYTSNDYPGTINELPEIVFKNAFLEAAGDFLIEDDISLFLKKINVAYQDPSGSEPTFFEKVLTDPKIDSETLVDILKNKDFTFDASLFLKLLKSNKFTLPKNPELSREILVKVSKSNNDELITYYLGLRNESFKNTISFFKAKETETQPEETLDNTVKLQN